MGKRKERRLAALSNAGRRVKLDLFAEPSGDVGGSDAHDKDGGDKKDSDELPNSPSSSGQQTQNPLLLLGQYSDDELEEDSDERVNHPTEQSSLADNKDWVEGLPDGGCKDVKFDQPHTETNSCSSDIRHKEENDDTECDATALGELQKQTDFSTQTTGAASSEFQTTGEVSSGWKKVLHEESNQYYYWNTETGETSWEVRDVLSLLAGATSDQNTNLTGSTEAGPVCTYECGSVSCVGSGNSIAGQNIFSESTRLISRSTVSDNGTQRAELGEGCKSEVLKDKIWVTDGDQSECQKNYAINALPCQEGFSCPKSSLNNAVGNFDNTPDIDLPTRLVGQSERLLEKLTSLKWSHGSFHGHEWISKYILEVEVRLSDVKALISHGSSLLPFWSHSETQLKRLEDTINDEIYQLAKSAVMNEIAETNISSLEEKEKSQESAGVELETDGSKGKLAPSVEIARADEVTDQNVTASDEVVPNVSFLVVEDVDMDVDMEVEDYVTTTDMPTVKVSTDEIFGQTEQSKLHAKNLSVAISETPAVPLSPVEEWIPPPPPDYEEPPPPPPDNDNVQIPPPPPDDEQVPPPPNDEFHESTYPPPPSYTEQSVPYTAQYNLTYSDSNYQYYGNVVAAVPNSQLYGHVTLPHASFYYGTVLSTSSEAVNSFEAYYNLKEGTVPSLSIPSIAESSQFLSESGSVSYNAVSMGSADVSAVTGPSLEVDASAVGHDSEMASSGIPSSSADSQVPSTASTNYSIPVSSQQNDVVTATVAGSSSSAKGNSKVVRTKKRAVAVAVAPTLRSNKKVSSLVDKWKAAKEELNESEEDEPESALEIQERKRRREIEEWRARQIASGEARDNANFQPLGGDWREKVKRRRAQAARKAAGIAAKAQKDENQQPDLAELSKDLLSGWQAYWDESTKEVYYGNTITSETSWTRPTK